MLTPQFSTSAQHNIFFLKKIKLKTLFSKPNTYLFSIFFFFFLKPNTYLSLHASPHSFLFGLNTEHPSSLSLALSVHSLC